MNNPNPFVPQTTLLDQKNKTRARVKVAVLTIFACNILLVGAVLLIQGCKREAAAPIDGAESNPITGMDLGMNTNPVVPPLPPVASNPPVTLPGATTLATTNPPAQFDTGYASEYVVVRGDTLAEIAKRSHVTLAALKAANPTVVETRMQIGTKLQIPAPTAARSTAFGSMAASTAGENTYLVKSGDTLTKIANAHGTTVQAIQTLNNLRTTQIRAGQTLKLPARTNSAMAPTESSSTPTTPSTIGNPVPPPAALR
jgi:LysM repeat protein